MDSATRGPLQQAMSLGAGVLRHGDRLRAAAETLTSLAGRRAAAGTASWEAANLVTVASALVLAATARTETRGSHWREDFPDTSEDWRGHLITRIGEEGTLIETWEPV